MDLAAALILWEPSCADISNILKVNLWVPTARNADQKQLRRTCPELGSPGEGDVARKFDTVSYPSYHAYTSSHHRPYRVVEITEKLWPFTGQLFDFVTYGSEGECLNFENVLYRVVLVGRWTLDPKRKWHMLVNTVVGIEVQVDEKAEQSTKDAAAAFTTALQAEGVLAVLKPTPNTENPAVISITVAKSPASMAPIEWPVL